eukprot:7378301-Prymnesium_polylepis.1
MPHAHASILHPPSSRPAASRCPCAVRCATTMRLRSSASPRVATRRRTTSGPTAPSRCASTASRSSHRTISCPTRSSWTRAAPSLCPRMTMPSSGPGRAAPDGWQGVCWRGRARQLGRSHARCDGLPRSWLRRPAR